MKAMMWGRSFSNIRYSPTCGDVNPPTADPEGDVGLGRHVKNDHDARSSVCQVFHPHLAVDGEECMRFHRR